MASEQEPEPRVLTTGLALFVQPLLARVADRTQLTLRLSSYLQITEKYMDLIRVTVLLKKIPSYPFCDFLKRSETYRNSGKRTKQCKRKRELQPFAAHLNLGCFILQKELLS